MGRVMKGTLLNEGKREKAYSSTAFLRVGGPEKRSAMPSASKALPWGMDPIRAMIFAPGGTVSAG